jgi:hypothetical protein
MLHPTSSVPAFLALVFASFITVDGAQAGIGGLSGGALSSFAHLSPVQTVQSGECWEQDGPDGPGYYPCGDGGGPIIGPLFRRHHRRAVVVDHPKAPNPIYPGAPSPRVGAGLHNLPGLRAGPAVSPGLAGVHGPGGATGVHADAPASPGPAGVGTFRAGGAAAAPHLVAPASPAVAGIGTFHSGGAVGASHIGAPAAIGLTGVHGAGGGGGAFQGGGIGHR